MCIFWALKSNHTGNGTLRAHACVNPTCFLSPAECDDVGAKRSKIASSTTKPTNSHVFQAFQRDQNPGNRRIPMASIKSRDKTTGYEKDDFFEKGLLTVSVCEDYKPTH
jgi:hypothetical protein